MRVTAVEGNSQRLDGGAMFGNAPKAMWERWIAPDERNRIPLSTRALLLQLDDGRQVLFETGVGAFFEPKLRDRYGIQEEEHCLLKNLGELGVKEEDIDVIILSHLHFDHVGGLLAPYAEGEEPRLLFPRAEIFVGKEHYERSLHPRMRERASFIPFLPALLEASGRLHLVEGDSHPALDFAVHFQFFEGHTLGLMVSIIEGMERPLAFVSDLIPGSHWVHIPISMGYDRFPERGIEEKQGFLEAFIERRGLLFFTHDPHLSCGEIQRDEKGRYKVIPYDLSTEH